VTVCGVDYLSSFFVAEEECGGDVFACCDGGEGESEVSTAHDGYADWVGWWSVVFAAVDHLE